MKAVILVGGLGTRISEETSTRPKPMVEVVGKPILWHILKIYSHCGIIGGRVVDMEAGPLRQPGTGLGVLVGADVVHDQVDVVILGD